MNSTLPPGGADPQATGRAVENNEPTLCQVLFGTGGSEPYRFVLVNFDQSLRVVSSMGLGDGQLTADAPFAQGRRFGDLFDSSESRAFLESHLEVVMAGGFSEAEVEFARGAHTCATRLYFMPRLHGPGRQRGFCLLVYDATEHRRAVRRTEGLRQRLSAILDNAADAILLIDEKGVIEEANRAALELFGWTYDELVGGPVTVLMDEANGQTHQSHIDRYLKTGVSGVLNVGPRVLPATHRDGRSIPIELSVGESMIEGRRKFIGVCRDIRQRLSKDRELNRVNDELKARVRELEQIQLELERERADSLALAAKAEAARASAEAANGPQSRLMAKISHELRASLNGILAVADLLARDRPTPDRELAEIVEQSSRDLRALVDEVLNMIKAEAAAPPSEQRPSG